MTARMAVPLDISEIEFLKNKAKEEGRTVSGYVQRILDKHLTKKLKKTKRKKLKRRK